jgi:predicted transcriptional regulator
VRLCDDCIKVLSDDLSQEAIDLLSKVALFNKLSERELVRKLSLNHNHIKKLVYELEAKHFLNSKQHGRTNVYLLTENGTRSLKFEEEEMNDSSQSDFKAEVIEEDKQEEDKQEESKQEESKQKEQESTKDESENLVWDFK